MNTKRDLTSDEDIILLMSLYFIFFLLIILAYYGQFQYVKLNSNRKYEEKKTQSKRKIANGKNLA